MAATVRAVVAPVARCSMHPVPPRRRAGGGGDRRDLPDRDRVGQVVRGRRVGHLASVMDGCGAIDPAVIAGATKQSGVRRATLWIASLRSQ